MTLQEWCRQTGIRGTHPTTERGAVSVIASAGRCGSKALRELHYLDDYKVSSVSGVVIWLVPILKPQPTAAAGGNDERREQEDEFGEWQDTGGEG